LEKCEEVDFFSKLPSLSDLDNSFLMANFGSLCHNVSGGDI
jgi:hypothetical protein